MLGAEPAWAQGEGVWDQPFAYIRGATQPMHGILFPTMG